MPYRFLLPVVGLFVSGGVIAGQNAPPSWPQFRGAHGLAICPDDKPLPVRFGPSAGVLWKTAVPAGVSSPCIWGERLFLTGYHPAEKKLETLCLDRASGKILWRQAAPATQIENVYKINSPASSTPASDGQRVFVSFGSYGLLCYDLDGKELWRKPLPTPRIGFGTATSPVLAHVPPLTPGPSPQKGEGNTRQAKTLLLLNSQGKDLHLMALDPATGDMVWTTEGTPFPSAYPAPFLWKNGNVAEVIVPGRGGLLAYDLRDGSKRWWVPGLSPEANTSPTQGEGFLFVASHLPGGDPDLRMTLPDFDELLKKYDKDKDGKISRKETPTDLLIFARGGKDGIGEIRLHQMYWLFDKNGDGHLDRKEWHAMAATPFNNALLAIRPGGTQDISQTHIAWQAKRGVPEVPSPLYYRGHLYMIRNGGILTCLDARTGKEAYPPQRLGPGGLFYASPVAGDGKVYLASDAGIVTVLKAGDQFEILAENDLGETLRATPALLDGKIYLRTAGHVYAFGE